MPFVLICVVALGGLYRCRDDKEKTSEADYEIQALCCLTENELGTMDRTPQLKTGDVTHWHVAQSMPFELIECDKGISIIQKMASAEMKSEKPEGKDGQRLG